MAKPQKDKDVVIHIDKKKKNSPTPTTGVALYILGDISEGYDLWRETKGGGDDELIPNDDTSVDLKNGDHFYSAQSTLNPGT